MNDIKYQKIIDTINLKSKKLKISTHEGKVEELKAVTFSQLVTFLNIGDKKDIEQLREIKRQLIALIENNELIELESEPTFYLLKKEFDEKLKSKLNISGIEGFRKASGASINK